MSIHGNSRKLLDEKMCFKLWYELGSIPKVQSHLKLAGHVNPNTGKQFTQMAIWNASIRWVLEHPDEAREYYLKAGDTKTQTQWEEWLTERAILVYGGSSRSRFFRYIKRMGFDKYDYVYADKYAIVPKNIKCNYCETINALDEMNIYEPKCDSCRNTIFLSDELRQQYIDERKRMETENSEPVSE